MALVPIYRRKRKVQDVPYLAQTVRQPVRQARIMRVMPQPRKYGARGGIGPGGETKYVDGFLNVVQIHELSASADDTWADTELNPRQTTAVYGCMPVPRQGTNYADRDGRKIFTKSLKIKGFVNFGAVDSVAAPTEAPFVRLIIVKDTRSNGVALSGEDVIGPGFGSDGQATTSGDGTAIVMPTNPNGWDRYKILWDKLIRMPTISSFGDDGAGNSTGCSVPFKVNLKVNCVQSFTDGVGAIGSVLDNSFHMLAAAQTSTTNAFLGYYARTSFTG